MWEASQQYAKAIEAARECIGQGLFRDAIKNAVAACDHIDGMLQYGRKYENREFDSIEAIDLIVAYAPVLLDFRKLDAVEQKLKSCRRIERETNTDINAQLMAARRMLWDAHRLWSHLEQNPECREIDLESATSVPSERSRRILAAWREIGLIRRTSDGDTFRVNFATRMAELVRGKCSHCGQCTEAPKAIFLSPLSCPSCDERAWFVILAGASGET